MTDILEKIKAYKLEEVKDAQEKTPLSELETMIASGPVACRDFEKALKTAKAQERYGIIAEIKKASPSKGLIRADFDPVSLAKGYAQGGATCLSILTDMPSFQGHNDYLIQARNAVSLPCLRKDFMFTPYQIIESRALGADCILLIMACLEDEQAKELEHIARSLGMDVLIETHNLSEVERALKHLKSDMIGINNRNLKTFETSLDVSKELCKHIPDNKLIICESGLDNKKDLDHMAAHNMTTFLIGESLMRQENVSDALRALL